MFNELDALKEADCAVIMTEWNEYRNLNLAKAKTLMKGNIILDMRNVQNPKKAEEYGFRYYSVGRIFKREK